MFCFKEYSLETDDPVFFKVKKDCTFFPSDKVVARDWARVLETMKMESSNGRKHSLILPRSSLTLAHI